MTFLGPWITPHTTRFGDVDATSPDDYITSYRGDTWDDARLGTGTTTVGPVQSTAPAASPGAQRVLDYEVFPFFTRYDVAQAFSWHSLPDVDPTIAFPPYVDAASEPGLPVVGVEYEAPHGDMLPSPRIEVVATTGGGNLNLPTALMDVYQIPGSVAGDSPDFLWIDGAALAASWSGYKIGSVTSVGPGVFIGPAADPAHAVVILVASATQIVTPFPLPTPDSTGFQLFAEIGVLVEYVGPRFRFVYDVHPPQRQFPRDDGLGISSRRSWPPPSTRQYGQRRGPVSTVL